MDKRTKEIILGGLEIFLPALWLCYIIGCICLAVPLSGVVETGYSEAIFITVVSYGLLTWRDKLKEGEK